MSNTKNVRLGVCSVFLGGSDLGYTKGGVEVEVKSDTHKVTIDQFGESVINEYIMKREVSAKVPLAETTLPNMVAIMPGATLVTTGGTAATGTITLSSNPTDGQTVIINGVTLTFKTTVGTGSAAINQVLLGGTVAASATNLAAFLNASLNSAFTVCSYVAATSTVTATAKVKGTDANSFKLATTGTASVTVSGATLTGGANPTMQRVDVTNGVGTNLLSIAQELRLHPISLPADDSSEDFVIPLAATAGALSFAYKFDQERVYNVEFSGYPDSATGRLYYVGDKNAV